MEKTKIHEFAAELSSATGYAIDSRYSEHHWAFALIVETGILLFAEIKKDKIFYNLSAYASEGRAKACAFKIGVSVSRGIPAHVAEIQKRLFPQSLDMTRGFLEEYANDDRQKARVISKAESLARKYPNLKIKASNYRVNIETKYGAEISVEIYAYQDSVNGIWRATSHATRLFRMNDIDSKSGRAFLKLINDN